VNSPARRFKKDPLVQTWPLRDNGQTGQSSFRQEKQIRLDWPGEKVQKDLL